MIVKHVERLCYNSMIHRASWESAAAVSIVLVAWSYILHNVLVSE
mgnify:CR=1 FL=1